MMRMIERVEHALRFALDVLSDEDSNGQIRLEAAGYVADVLAKLAVFDTPPPPPVRGIGFELLVARIAELEEQLVEEAAARISKYSDAMSKLLAHIREVEGLLLDVTEALRDLADEQVDAPAEKRRGEWEAAVRTAYKILPIAEAALAGRTDTNEEKT
jgi:hypothetical protein